MKRDLAAIKDQFGDDRRMRIEEVAATREIDWSAMIEKEPITVILSQRGWIRAMRGHVALDDAETLKFREGDALATIFHAQTTDRIALFAANGRVYTLGGDKLPGGRGFGEPVRLMIELGNEVEIVALFKHQSDRRLIVAEILEVGEDARLGAVERCGDRVIDGDVVTREREHLRNAVPHEAGTDDGDARFRHAPHPAV